MLTSSLAFKYIEFASELEAELENDVDIAFWK